MDAERDGAHVTLHDRVWEDMTPDGLPDPRAPTAAQSSRVVPASRR